MPPRPPHPDEPPAPRASAARTRPAAATRTSPRLGYPCLNLALGIGTNRTLRLASITDTAKLRSVIDANLANLQAILRFNAEHGVHIFRVGSQFIPFASHPAFPYDWRTEHAADLTRLAALARSFGARLSIHPGQYTVPGSPDPRIRAASLAELRYAADLIDILSPEEGVVVLHVGGAYGDKPTAARRFIASLDNEPAILRRLALENDERTWSAAEVIPIARSLGVPTIIDTLHHRLNPGDPALPLPRAIELALPTWGTGRGGRRPKLHISSQDPTKNPGAHAYTIDAPDWDELLAALRAAGREDADIMLESKGKEQSLRPYGHPTIPALPQPTATTQTKPISTPRTA